MQAGWALDRMCKVLLAGARAKGIERKSRQLRGVGDLAVKGNRYKVIVASRIGNLGREGESSLRGTVGQNDLETFY